MCDHVLVSVCVSGCVFKKTPTRNEEKRKIWSVWYCARNLKQRKQNGSWFSEFLIQVSLVPLITLHVSHPAYGISEIKSSAFAIFWHKDNSPRVTSASTEHLLLASKRVVRPSALWARHGDTYLPWVLSFRRGGGLLVPDLQAHTHAHAAQRAPCYFGLTVVSCFIALPPSPMLTSQISGTLLFPTCPDVQ